MKWQKTTAKTNQRDRFLTLQRHGTVRRILIPKLKLIFFVHFGIPDPLLWGSQRCLLNYRKKGMATTISGGRMDEQNCDEPLFSVLWDVQGQGKRQCLLMF